MPAPSAFVEGDAPPLCVAPDPNEGAARCFHCGSPNPRGSRWRGEIAGAARSFCCAGCLGVAQTIHAAGLDGFYQRRTATADAPETARDDDDEWSRWDAEAAQAGFVRDAGAGRREASLLLEGLHCGACIWLIESWLGRQPGIDGANVNFATRRAQVRWDPKVTHLSQVLRAVAAIGYRAYPYDPAQREAHARSESRTLLLRLAVALLAMMQVMMFAVPTYVTIDGVEPAHRRLLEWASLTLTMPALLYSAAPFFRGAWRDLRLRRPGMDVPVAIGLLAAFAGSVAATLGGSGEVYYDSITMFVALLLAARYLELVARRRAGDAIEACARARPAVAERLPGWPASVAAETVGAGELREGDAVLVRPGATVPADGVIVDGSAAVEEAILTGESRPRPVSRGAAVLSGSVVRDGALVVRVTGAGEATRLAAIERLAERAGAFRPRVARVADRVAQYFVAALLVVAAVAGAAWWWIEPSRALPVTFALLVVSCPCALSLATPAALAAATAALTRRQVVIARADALEALSRVTHVVFDKTGTLTRGRVTLQDTELRGVAREEVLRLAAALEARSEHPLARAFRDGVDEPSTLPVARDVTVVPGQGIEGVVDGRRLRIGRPAFVAALGGSAAPATSAGENGAAIRVALGDATGLLARFTLGDALRPDAAELVLRLRRAGITPSMLSGDSAAGVAAVAGPLGIADAHGDLRPEDKRDRLARLQDTGAVVAMVGDGINDAPSLAQAQVSVSLGSATPLAQWTADVVVLSDELARIADAIGHARRTFRIVRQNLFWAFAYNAIAIPAAAAGFVTPLLAALGMSASSLVVVGNALRAARLGGSRGGGRDDAPRSSAPTAA